MTALPSIAVMGAILGTAALLLARGDAGKKTDQERFVGTWGVADGRADGQPIPDDARAVMRLTFAKDGKAALNLGVGAKDCTYKLPAAGQIDVSANDDKDVGFGIYKFQGDDRLTICLSIKGGRPTDYNADKGTDQILLVLERTKPGEKQPTAEQMAKYKEGSGKVLDAAVRLQSQGNLKQIALAMHNYIATYKKLPMHAIYSKDGKTPLLSWRVTILPYIEQQALYNQFKLDEAWDSDHNKKLIAKMPKIYEPLGLGQKREGYTYYQVFSGPETVFDGNNKMTFQKITDGTSYTLMVAEAKQPVIWTKPDDLVMPRAKDQAPAVGGLFKDGWHAAFCDGSVWFLRHDIPVADLRALITPSGGESVNPERWEQGAKEFGPYEARKQSKINLKQLGLAMHVYYDAHKCFPLHALYSRDGAKPLLSWRVAILPYVEQDALYKQFHLDEPWDSEHNKQLIAKMPAIYEPLGMGQKREGYTYYQVFTGPGTVFEGTKKIRLQDIKDGTSNTLMIVEAKQPVIWTKPDDLPLPRDKDAAPAVGGLFKEGWHAVFCDGHVAYLRHEIPAAILRALITRDGGEPVDTEQWEKQ